MLLRVLNVLMLILNAGMALVSLLGFIGWAADPSPNKWGALFCFLFSCVGLAFFWSLHRKGTLWKRDFAQMSPQRQTHQGIVLLMILILPVGRIVYESIGGRPTTTSGEVIEFAVLGATYAACAFGFARWTMKAK